MYKLKQEIINSLIKKKTIIIDLVTEKNMCSYAIELSRIRFSEGQIYITDEWYELYIDTTECNTVRIDENTLELIYEYQKIVMTFI